MKERRGLGFRGWGVGCMRAWAESWEGGGRREYKFGFRVSGVGFGVEGLGCGV